MIQQSVMAEAGAQAQKLQDQAREFKETAMKKAEEEVLQELYCRIQDEITEIHTSATRSVSQKETKERQDLLLRREEITRAVFEQVKRRLLDFTRTPAYHELMNEIAKELGARCPMEGTIVMLRRDDYHLSAKLGEHFGKNVRILADEAIKIGGIKVMNQSSGIFLDETLDSRLEDQKPWFYSHSGLTITSLQQPRRAARLGGAEKWR